MISLLYLYSSNFRVINTVGKLIFLTDLLSPYKKSTLNKMSGSREANSSHLDKFSTNTGS